jgi:GNAT superfamily N-acetyltransferase
VSGASIVAPVPTIARASPPDPDADAVVTEGLRRHLRPLWGLSGRLDVAWYLRDDDGRVVGGILGHLAWSWLYLERVWVDDAWRGRGHGAALMQAAETFAVEHHCEGIHLDTFGDDALPFYRRLGYDVWGTLDGLPPGSRKHCLRKSVTFS